MGLVCSDLNLFMFLVAEVRSLVGCGMDVYYYLTRIWLRYLE